ncbi:MAG: M1 family metallopeptidase [Dissulfurispiraceae bacterium]
MRYAIVIVFVILMLSSSSLSGQQGSQVIPQYDLDVSIDVSHSKINGTARVVFQSGQELLFKTGTLNIIVITMDGKPVHFNRHDDTVSVRSEIAGAIEIQYEGLFGGPPPSNNGRDYSGQVTIGKKGVFLTGTWYPRIEGLCTFDLKATLPEKFIAISESESTKETMEHGKAVFAFHFPHPVDRISLIATDRFIVSKDSFHGIALYAYFFPEDSSLALSYIEHTKKYLKLYESLLTPYPFKRFCIVENFLPTGYSMPTYTLLGQDVVRLPFIVETSLGHEILHQWFGNSVYIDFDNGNWAEGLTTYLADQLYEEQKGNGWSYRKQILIDYESYVNAKNEFSLRNFRGRVDFSSRAIGYGKAAMVFDMLRKSLGDDLFFSSIKHFITNNSYRMATWDDLRVSFEKTTGKALAWFFKQWIDATGIPELHLEAVHTRESNKTVEVKVTVSQQPAAYSLYVPLSFYYADGSKTDHLLWVAKKTDTLTISLDRRPVKMIIDENYDLMRKLSKEEFPPVIARLMGARRIIIALPSRNAEMYEDIINTFIERGAVAKKAAMITDNDIKTSSLIVLGDDNPLCKTLYGEMKEEGGFSVRIKENPLNQANVVGIFDGKSTGEVQAAFGKIYHYGKYSFLSFDSGKNIRKEINISQRGILKILDNQIQTDNPSLKSL